MDDPSSPPPPAPGGGAVREEMVQNGVAFLLHPRVQQAPLSQRITFLEKKGLSQEEVAEALARVKRQGADGGGSSNNSTAAPAPLDQLYGDGPSPAAGPSYPGPPGYGGGRVEPYMHDAPPPPPPPPMWHQPGVMLPGAVVAGLALGAGAAHLIRLRRRQEEQEREQRMLEMEFRERRRQHHHHPRFDGMGMEGREGRVMVEGGSFDGSGSAQGFLPAETPMPEEQPQPQQPLGGEEGEEEGLQPPPPPQPFPMPHADGESSLLSMKELARAIETQAQALTALAQASERSRQDLHALLTGQVAAQTADIRSELSTIKQVLLLCSSSASAASANGASIAALLENGGNGNNNRLALMGGTQAAASSSSSSSSSSVVEALPTPTPTPTKEAGAAAADEADAGGEEGSGSGSAFSSPTKGGQLAAAEDKEEEEDEEAKAARAAAAAAARLHWTKLRRMCDALKGMQAGNAPGVLHDGVDMLLIYVNNLIKYPTVPRFRKVALVNQGYKERVAKVQGHEEFLQSLGYAEGAACFEWEGHLAAGQEAKDNLTLLQTALALLTAVKSGAAPAWPEGALLEGGGEGADEEEPEQEREQEPSVAAAAANDDAPPLDEARVHALLHPNSPPPPQQQQEGAEVAGRPAAAGENKTDSAPSSPLSAAAETTAVVSSSSSSSVVGTGGVGQGGEPPLATPPPPNPQYPKSFMEIMQMAERGETPDGIQQVENRLSDDVSGGRAFPSAGLSPSRPVRKPWEQAAPAGEQEQQGDAGLS